jgi:hypothetical protein
MDKLWYQDLLILSCEDKDIPKDVAQGRTSYIKKSIQAKVGLVRCHSGTEEGGSYHL